MSLSRTHSAGHRQAPEDAWVPPASWVRGACPRPLPRTVPTAPEFKGAPGPTQAPSSVKWCQAASVHRMPWPGGAGVLGSSHGSKDLAGSERPNEVGLTIEFLETWGVGVGGVNIWCFSFNSELLQSEEDVNRRYLGCSTRLPEEGMGRGPDSTLRSHLQGLSEMRHGTFSHQHEDRRGLTKAQVTLSSLILLIFLECKDGPTPGLRSQACKKHGSIRVQKFASLTRGRAIG